MNTFSGSSPTQASLKLRDFVKQTADDAGVSLEFLIGDKNAPGAQTDWIARADKVRPAGFYLNLIFPDDRSVPYTLGVNPRTEEFGAGQLTTDGSVIPLILKRTNDGLFEWWTEAYSPEGNEIIGPFVLTSDYIGERLRSLTSQE